MTLIVRKSYLYLFLLSIILVQACQSTKHISDESSGSMYHKSKENPETVLHSIPDYTNQLRTISGKAKVIVSQPGNVERGTIFFNSDRKQTLFTFKNGLGIEGGQLYFDRDSVLVYNRIDKYARKMSLLGYSYVYLNGIEPINPLDLISPPLNQKKVKSLSENDSFYRITFHDGTRVIINKNTHLIKKITYSEGLAINYTTIIFDGYAELNNYELPRKIQILSSDKKSNIFLLIQSLEVNPKNLTFSIKLPAHISIERQ